MKKVLLITAILVVAIFGISYAEDVGLMWDAATVPPDGYRIFMHEEGSAYDYLNPIIPKGMATADIPSDVFTVIAENVGPQLPNLLSPVAIDALWDKDNSTITLSWSQQDAVATQKYYFVARSFIGEQESVNSNEISKDIATTNPVDHWILYFSESSGGPWTELDTIQNDGSALVVTSPLTVVAEGEMKTIYFTCVAFNSVGDFSPNSNELSVVIDRRLPVPPPNFRFVTVVPVQ